jgi:hypothetical protein
MQTNVKLNLIQGQKNTSKFIPHIDFTFMKSLTRHITFDLKF